MKIPAKKTIRAGVAMLCLFFIAVWLVAFNDDYRLNRVVRLVSMRISQFEWLSYIRKEPYRIVFNTKEYSVWNMTRAGEWVLFVRHTLPADIRTNEESLELYVSGGGISSLKVNDRQKARLSVVRLEFRLVDKESKKRGFVFSGKGKWRVL